MSYVQQNQALLHSSWAVDPHAIVAARGSRVAAILNATQRLVRKASWWHSLPQWQQISTFHGAVVRLFDSLIAQQGKLEAIRQQLDRIENQLRAEQARYSAVYDAITTAAVTLIQTEAEQPDMPK